MKTPLLFLCHRIPYPPNKGDKIRSFHLLHHLSRHFAVHLATFVDDPADWAYVPDVEKFCESSLFVPLKAWRATLRGFSGLLTGEALSVPYYASRQMDDWVREQVEDQAIRHVLVFSSSMAQFVMHPEFKFRRKVIDFVDIDSDKWEQYSRQKPFPLSSIYRREARCLLEFERRLAEDFDAGLFVSSTEAEMFKQLSPATAQKIGYYNNGVNTEYFQPAEGGISPYPSGSLPIVFTGAMDYWPNIDAVLWFAQEVFPQLHASNPALRFYVVGSNPSKAVRQLAGQAGIVVTGRVEDVRPYLQHALFAIAPMRIARGVQNKVLEAMAMERVVIVSRKGLEGIDAEHGKHVLLADEANEYIAFAEELVAGQWSDIGGRARALVSDQFVWDNNLPEVVLLLKDIPSVSEVSVSNG